LRARWQQAARDVLPACYSGVGAAVTAHAAGIGGNDKNQIILTGGDTA